MDTLIKKFLETHVLFKDYANPDFLTSLIAEMKPRLYVDGAFIIKKVAASFSHLRERLGVPCFLISRESLMSSQRMVWRVSQSGETIINVMEEGSFFGEIGLLYSVPRFVSSFRF